MAIGMGIGAFASGMAQGMQLGSQVKGAIEDRQLRKINKEGSAAASTAREKDIMGAITTTPNADGSSSFSVGGKAQASIEDARKAAEAQVGSVMDYYRSTTVPKLIQGYIDHGRPEQAQQLQTYMETHEANQLTKDWAKAGRLAMMGDTGGAMKQFGRLYARMEPGASFVGTEDIEEPVYEQRKLPKTGEMIQVQTGTRNAGVRLKLRNADGEDISHDFGGTEDLYRTAMFTLSPDKFAALALAEVDAAQKSRAEAAAAAAKADREFRTDIGKQTHKATLDDTLNQRQFERGVMKDDRQFAQQGQRDATQQSYDLEKIMTTKQLDAAFAPAMEAAKSKGDTPEAARKAISDIWKSMIAADLPGEDSFKSKPIEDQVKRASDIYMQQRTMARGVIRGGEDAPKGPPRLW